jgi:outer membrane lipoprotein carrier protein
MFAFAGNAWCQSADTNDDARGMAPLESFLADVRSLTADFQQQLWTADERLIETASGTLGLKRPNRFLWSYVAPIEQLVAADGKNLWMYDVELAQATVAPLEESTASSPAMLLSSDRAVRDNFDFVRAFTRDGLEWIELAPKLDGTDFRSVSIGFQGRAPQRLTLVDGLNQVTRIEFSNVVVNPELSDTAFDFTPPAGVDVIGRD